MRAKQQNKREIKRQWYCEETGVTFYNFDNYFRHQQKVREWYNRIPQALEKALEMIQVTFPEIKVVTNKSEYQIIQDDEKICYPMEHMHFEVVLDYKGKEIKVCNYPFTNIDQTCAEGLYMIILRYYILPLRAGFNCYEDYEVAKLPYLQRQTVKQELDEIEEMYKNYYIASEVE